MKTIRIMDKTHKELKIKAARAGVSMMEYLHDLVKNTR